MVFLCGSLAVAVTGIECAIAFMPQSAAFLVATHGAVLGTTFARRASAPERADKFHAFALMCALAAEFFVIMFNTNMLLNYWSSFLVAAHMLYFFVWAPDPLVKKRGTRSRGSSRTRASSRWSSRPSRRVSPWISP